MPTLYRFSEVSTQHFLKSRRHTLSQTLNKKNSLSLKPKQKNVLRREHPALSHINPLSQCPCQNKLLCGFVFVFPLLFLFSVQRRERMSWGFRMFFLFGFFLFSDLLFSLCRGENVCRGWEGGCGSALRGVGATGVLLNVLARD